MSAMKVLLAKYADAGAEVSIRFRSDFAANGGPSGGPGKIARVDAVGEIVQGEAAHPGDLFQLSMPVMAGRPGQQPVQGEMPIVFSAADVLWVSSGIKIPEQPMIATPGGRRQGGLVVPGS